MKRILSLIALMFVLAIPSFAEDTYDEDEDMVTEVYDMNGRGDQYIKISMMPSFPLNFGDKLETGGMAQLGYYRYLNSWVGLGLDLVAGYNPTLGSNILTYVPITFGATFLPTLWKFEFPCTVGVGFAFETCQNKKYFPGFAAKAEVGAYYRLAETWSFGLGSSLYYLPQWYTTTKGAESDYGLFMTAFASVRYHF